MRLHVSMIVAMDPNNVIGFKNRIPWFDSNDPTIQRIRQLDLQRFKRITLGGTVVMGRKTCESIGKPLIGRRNVVLSRRDPTELQSKGFEIVSSISGLHHHPRHSNSPIFIIGGSQIYELFLPYANRLYLTVLHSSYMGDAMFPQIEYSQWYEDWEDYEGYSFITLSKKI